RQGHVYVDRLAAASGQLALEGDVSDLFETEPVVAGGQPLEHGPAAFGPPGPRGRTTEDHFGVGERRPRWIRDEDGKSYRASLGGAPPPLGLYRAGKGG